jgi:hypothetical protein
MKDVLNMKDAFAEMRIKLPEDQLLTHLKALLPQYPHKFSTPSHPYPDTQKAISMHLLDTGTINHIAVCYGSYILGIVRYLPIREKTLLQFVDLENPPAPVLPREDRQRVFRVFVSDVETYFSELELIEDLGSIPEEEHIERTVHTFEAGKRAASTGLSQADKM